MLYHCVVGHPVDNSSVEHPKKMQLTTSIIFYQVKAEVHFMLDWKMHEIYILFIMLLRCLLHAE